MPDEMSNIVRSDVTFINVLRRSEYSSIFHVCVRGQECVMKVYHNREPCSAASTLYEHSTFVCESKAYRRLKERGLCQRGLVPDFFGCITRMNPTSWRPHLNNFLKDKLLPSAIFIEYVPNMRMMDLSTYSSNRMQKFIQALNEMHEAKIFHDDVYPRNMMVIPGSPDDRVLWIDFDRSQTFSEPLTKRQEGWIQEETEIMDDFASELAADYKQGKLENTWHLYFE